VTTHVLDASRGGPAAGVPIRLECLAPADGSPQTPPKEVVRAATDVDGRAGPLGSRDLPVGRYRLTFDTAAYFANTGQDGFYPEVSVTFTIDDPAQRYHVPLLLSPYAFSTYRGS
jgi:5-hydroxyisourate hydrolase